MTASSTPSASSQLKPGSPLLETQRVFLGHILAEDADLPAGWDNQHMRNGLAVYRNAYRARLVEALGETYPRTLQWVGEESFSRAAAHHVILHPPVHWSLDQVGTGFAETLAQLFANDEEVAELASLEWDMHCAFVAADAPVLDRAGFVAATGGFGDEDWQGLRLQLFPALIIRPIFTRAAAIWQALQQEVPPPEQIGLEKPLHILVWREGTRPVFRIAQPDEAQCLYLLGQGRSFGDICAELASTMPQEHAAQTAGLFLGEWLGEGLISALR